MTLGRIGMVVAVLAGLACSTSAEAPKGGAGPAPARPEPPAAPAAEPLLFRRTRSMMGTVVSITVVGVPDSRAAPAVDAAFREMEGLEAILSEWRPDSEISRINAAAGKAEVKVGPHTMAVVKAGLEVSEWSSGAFDISWAALRGLYSFQRDESKVPDMDQVRRRLPLINYKNIRVDEAASSIMLTQPGMQIGTGGIAKGYALDRAAGVLVNAGMENFMLFGGGQVQVRGRKFDHAWRIGVQHPRRQDYFAMLEAERGSVSTSGDYEHAFVKDGKRWHHIINPRTGEPVEHTSSVTILAESGLYADAISTAVFILGPQKALPMLKTAPGGAQALVVDGDMGLHMTKGMGIVFKTKLVDGRLPL